MLFRGGVHCVFHSFYPYSTILSIFTVLFHSSHTIFSQSIHSLSFNSFIPVILISLYHFTIQSVQHHSHLSINSKSFNKQSIHIRSITSLTNTHINQLSHSFKSHVLDGLFKHIFYTCFGLSLQSTY